MSFWTYKHRKEMKKIQKHYTNTTNKTSHLNDKIIEKYIRKTTYIYKNYLFKYNKEKTT